MCLESAKHREQCSLLAGAAWRASCRQPCWFSGCWLVRWRRFSSGWSYCSYTFQADQGTASKVADPLDATLAMISNVLKWSSEINGEGILKSKCNKLSNFTVKKPFHFYSFFFDVLLKLFQLLPASPFYGCSVSLSWWCIAKWREVKKTVAIGNSSNRYQFISNTGQWNAGARGLMKKVHKHTDSSSEAPSGLNRPRSGAVRFVQ